MKKYEVPFEKTTWGCLYIKAKSKEDAIERCLSDCYDECDNKAEYKIDEKNVQAIE